MDITWYGHSCFSVEHAGYTVLFDPYTTGSVPGLKLPELHANEVLCSHEHKDHCNAEAVQCTAAASPFTVKEMEVFHDHHEGANRGKNVIRVLEADGLRVAHLGDLGHLLTPAQANELGQLDLVLIPVGGHFTIDPAEAKQVLEMLQPRVAIPMHYRGQGFGYPVIGTLDAFTDLCEDVQHYDGNRFTLTQSTPQQTAVLTLPPQVLAEA